MNSFLELGLRRGAARYHSSQASLACLLCFYSGASQPSLRKRRQGKGGGDSGSLEHFSSVPGPPGAMAASFPGLSHCLWEKQRSLSSSQLASFAGHWTMGSISGARGSWMGPSIPLPFSAPFYCKKGFCKERGKPQRHCCLGVAMETATDSKIKALPSSSWETRLSAMLIPTRGFVKTGHFPCLCL